MEKNWKQVLDLNIKELEELIYEYDEHKLNSKEALGKVFYSLVAIKKIIEKLQKDIDN